MTWYNVMVHRLRFKRVNHRFIAYTKWIKECLQSHTWTNFVHELIWRPQNSGGNEKGQICRSLLGFSKQWLHTVCLFMQGSTLSPQGMRNKDGIVKDECMCVCTHRDIYACMCMLSAHTPTDELTASVFYWRKTTVILFWVTVVSFTETVLMVKSQSL